MNPTVMSIAMKDMGQLIEFANANKKWLPGPVVNVQGIGAKGDGEYDDSLFLQDAFNVDDVGEIWFPPGDYLIKSKLTISKTVKLVGSKGTRILIAGTAHGIFVSADRVEIENIEFVSLNYRQYYGDVTVQANHFNIHHCKFTGKGWAGLNMIDGAENTTASFNEFADYSYMIHGQGSSNHIITHNHFTGGNIQGGGISDGDGVKLTSNADHFGDPSYLGTTYNVITNNIFDGVYRDAVDLFTDGSKTIFSNNLCIGVETAGLDIKVLYRDPPYTGGTSITNVLQESFLIVEGNQFYNLGTTTDDCAIDIRLVDFRSSPSTNPDDGANYITVSNNIFKSVVGFPVRIVTSKGIDINHNQFFDNVNRNISITGGCEDINISHNKFYLPETNTQGAIASTSPTNARIAVSHNEIYGANVSSNVFGVQLAGTDCRAEDNYIENVQVGVYGYSSANSKFSGNKVRGATIAGLRFGNDGPTVLADVANNRCSNCLRAILYDAKCSNIIASNNVASNCTNAFVNTGLINTYTDVNNQTETISNWTSSTAYAVGKLVKSSGNIYQCTTAGTSGTTGPSQTSGSSTDGTVVWLYVYTP